MASEIQKETVLLYLKSLQNRGIFHIAIDEEIRPVLNAWIKGRPALAASEEEAAPPAVIRLPRPSDQDDAETDASSEKEPEERPIFRVAGHTRLDQFHHIQRHMEHWEPIAQLTTLRPHPIFSPGNLHAPIMFIGDAPGYQEEKDSLPFTGKSGEKLTQILQAMGLTRAMVYLTHIVKHRPATPMQMTNDRPPSETELAAFLPITMAEIEMVSPKVIVALGITAARALLGEKEAPLSALRGKVLFSGETPVIVSHHPRYLLSTDELSEKRLVWEDMLRAMELAHLPITPKQRGFFMR